MEYPCILTFIVLISNVGVSKCAVCFAHCPWVDQHAVCAFDPYTKKYSMFRNQCAMEALAECHKINYLETPLKYCVKDSIRRTGDAVPCPVSCPGNYKPVCGASKLESYGFRSFINRCHLDMDNCRGNDDSGYVEVPYSFCFATTKIEDVVD